MGADPSRPTLEQLFIMNKIFLGAFIALTVFFNWDMLTADTQLPENFTGAHSQEVVLYATSWCGYCAKARKFFTDNNIPFTEYDIEKSREGRSQYDELNGKGVPLILVNGEIIRGYNLAAIKQAMATQQ